MGKSRSQLPSLLAGLEKIDPPTFERLLAETALSRGYLRKKLRLSGIPLHPLVEGVRQDSPDALERTLIALSATYADEPAAARTLVLDARRHADFALKKDPTRAPILLHLRTWLENPPVYPAWLALYKAKPPGEWPGG